MKLINKDAVVAEIKSYIYNYKEIVTKTDRNDSNWIDSVSMIDAKIDVLQHLLSFLDTLEVKEVNLDEEIEECLKQYHMIAVGKEEFEPIAKYFFELGLKAQKGE